MGELSYPIYILHVPVLIPIYLLVNKYYLQIFPMQSPYDWIIKYTIAYIIFCFCCFIILTIIQKPIDLIRNKIKELKKINIKKI